MSVEPTTRPGAISLRGRLERLYDEMIAPLAPKIEGFVDRIIADEAFGWAFDRRRPNRRVLVVALHNGQVIAEALSDLPRRDLVGLGKGDGRCGFRLKLPADLPPEARDALRIEGRSGIRRRLLKRAKRFRQEAAPGVVEPVRNRAAPPAVGFLERCTMTVLKGWAIDPSNPEAMARVDVFDGELFLGSTIANIERPRLRESGAPAGARGFEFRAPEGRSLVPARVRARVAGTRIDLRKSRSYPGDGQSQRAGGSKGGGLEAVETLEAQTPAPAPSRPRPVADKTVLVVSGDGAPEAVAATLQSWEEQVGAPTEAVVVSGLAGPDKATGLVGAEDETALRALLGGAHTVLFLAPGQTAAPDLARRILDHDLSADVLYWRDGDRLAGPDADLAIRLGARSSGLAVRGAALNAYAGSLAAALVDGGLDWLESWVAVAGLTWSPLTGDVVSGAARRHEGGPAVRTAPAPRRVSLAVWSGWGEAPPPAVPALLADSAGYDVEVLAPAGVGDPAAWLAALDAPGARSLSLRLVDAPARLGEAGLWRAMGEAATGQVVIFCEGEILCSRGLLGAAAGWALERGIGPVTVPLADGDRARLAGLDIERGKTGAAVVSAFDAKLGPLDRPVLAAPAAFMAVSRAALAQVDGVDAEQWTGAPADVDLSLRLRRLGRRAVLLGGREAVAPAPVLARWLRRPLPAPLMDAWLAELQTEGAATPRVARR